MQRIYAVATPENNLAAEQQATANQTAAEQLLSTAQGRSGIAGNMMNPGAHLSALPSFAFVVVMAFILFWLVFHSHLSLAASVGVGKR